MQCLFIFIIIAIAVTKCEVVSYCCCIVTQLADDRLKLAFVDQYLRPAAGKYIVQFRLTETVIEWYQNGSEFGGSKESLQYLYAVHRQHTDAIATFNACLMAQKVGQPRG